MLPLCTDEARYLLQAGKNQAMSPGVSYMQGSAVRFHAMFPQAWIYSVARRNFPVICSWQLPIAPFQQI